MKLHPRPDFHPRGPLLLVIMDGVGIGKRDDSDGVFLADTPELDALTHGWSEEAARGATKPPFYTSLQAHGTAVGMPSDGDMGNSEVGHNALGAGRVFHQGAALVQRSIDEGAIYETPLWSELIERANAGGTLHFIGLLSDGNVHSHIEHLFALLRRCGEAGVRRVRVHALLDGRDVYEKSALTYVERTEAVLAEQNDRGADYDYRIASGGGRMVTTMDRYFADWSVVQRGWEAHVHGVGQAFRSAADAIQAGYDGGATDQYLDSFVVVDENERPVGRIEDGDGVVFFNFRGDRAIEITMAFEGKDFPHFDRGRVPEVLYAGMMEYDGDLKLPANYLVDPPQIDESIGIHLCDTEIRSFAISETQKYGHVTYFWNGNNSGYVDERFETYVEIPSDKVRFDEKPKMKAAEITDRVIGLLESGEYAFGRVNFANGDRVGHTGNRDAVIEAMTTVDGCVRRLRETIEKLGGTLLVTADHGNADELYTVKKGKKSVSTAHSLNRVPFVIFDPGYRGEYRLADLETRGLSNVAATVIELLGYEKPENYDPSLIECRGRAASVQFLLREVD